ncbi:hypothetical protein JZ751_022412 [Albula glossodonta]|uniref:Uncharacterized protein n=1 Tax=Albula glossodonta TaxID=121402 RepID=A0A8T2MQL2_9TELE|nr:hypothetical protein JZ751_022412 [Albula glossodonta]
MRNKSTLHSGEEPKPPTRTPALPLNSSPAPATPPPPSPTPAAQPTVSLQDSVSKHTEECGEKQALPRDP